MEFAPGRMDKISMQFAKQASLIRCRYQLPLTKHRQAYLQLKDPSALCW